MKWRQATCRFGLERDRAADFGRLVSELHHRRRRAASCEARRARSRSFRPSTSSADAREATSSRMSARLLRQLRARARSSRKRLARSTASTRSSAATTRFPRQLRTASRDAVQDVQQPQERRGVRGTEIGDVRLRERQAQDHQILQIVVGDPGHRRRDDEPRPHETRQRRVQ